MGGGPGHLLKEQLPGKLHGGVKPGAAGRWRDECHRTRISEATRCNN